MAMLANIPFYIKVNRIALDDSGFEPVYLDEFYSDIDDLKYQEVPQLQILENRKMFVMFSSQDREARLEMDGFDGLKNPELVHDDGIYMDGTGDSILVFDTDNFPLPPGRYVITVYANGENYYTGFEILSAAFKDSSIWHAMMDDILANIPFQSVDYAYIRKLSQDISYNEASPNLMWKMLILNQEYNNVMSALRDIKLNPHNKLIKEYHLVNVGIPSVSDNKAIHLNQSKAHDSNKRFAVQKSLSYKLSENCFLKKMLQELYVLINNCCKEAESSIKKISCDINNVKHENDKEKAEYIRMLKAQNFIGSYAENVRSMQKAVMEALGAEWIKDLKPVELGMVSVQSFSDPRYNVIYTLFNKLDRIYEGFSADKKFTMLWRRTSLLYEYWNIIYLAKSLSKMGFILRNNAKAVQDDNNLRVLALDSEDFFIFSDTSEYLTVKMYYEPIIPSAAHINVINYNDQNKFRAEIDAKALTNKQDKPLYTKSFHNTPDCLMNFYVKDKTGNEIYLGALVLDFKYKKRRTVWQDKDMYQFIRRDPNAQFKEYKSGMRTLFMGDCDGTPGNVSDMFLLPVHEVWGVYPDTEKPGNVEFKPGFDVRLISNIPGDDMLLGNQLRLFIERLVPEFKFE